jgi:phosphoglycerate kinase
VIETEPFAIGTHAIARTLARLHAVRIVGGGDTAAALQQAGVLDEMTHVSTGGGAFLRFLEGGELPAVVALEQQRHALAAA